MSTFSSKTKQTLSPSYALGWDLRTLFVKSLSLIDIRSLFRYVHRLWPTDRSTRFWSTKKYAFILVSAALRIFESVPGTARRMSGKFLQHWTCFSSSRVGQWGDLFLQKSTWLPFQDRLRSRCQGLFEQLTNLFRFFFNSDLSTIFCFRFIGFVQLATRNCIQSLSDLSEQRIARVGFALYEQIFDNIIFKFIFLFACCAMCVVLKYIVRVCIWLILGPSRFDVIFHVTLNLFEENNVWIF